MFVSTIKSFLARQGRYWLFVTIATLFWALCFSASDFVNTPVAGGRDALTVLFQWGVVSAASFFLIALLAVNRTLFAVLFPLLSVVSAVLAYYRYTLNFTLNTMVMDIAFSTDRSIVADLITGRLVAFLLFSAAVSVGLARFRWRRSFAVPSLWSPLFAAGVLLLLLWPSFPFRNPVMNRIPFNLYHYTALYLKNRQETARVRPALHRYVRGGEDSLTVVLVLGESLRADHLGINGYERNTTPRLAECGVVSFPNVYSEYTYTNRSIPYLMTRADTLHPERAFTERSFIDLFREAGFRTYWLSNQEAENGYSYFMEEADRLEYVNVSRSPYVFEKWLDEDLLEPYAASLADAAPRKLIVLHTIGSHWWYNSHFTEAFEQYRPIIRSRIISSCTPEQVVNSYDNTVLYTDHVLSQVIAPLKERRAILLYVSDHGELLGEDGAFLHALEHPVLHSAAAFVWASERYAFEEAEKMERVRENRTKRWNSSFLYHSILDAASIESDLYESRQSIFAGEARDSI